MLGCALVVTLAAFITLVGSSTQASATAQGAPTLPAIITVTNTEDSGPGSLRTAIAQAVPGDTINFNVTGAINLSSGALTINKDLIISGPGADILAVERNSSAPDFRIFTVESGAKVAIYGLSISRGRSAASPGDAGGGIANNATLTLDSCRLTDNFAIDGGGGIHNAGTMSLKNCLVAANVSEGVGGGILNDGMLTISESVVEHNEARGEIAGAGGGIVNNGTLTLNNSTISYNFARIYGGALYNSGQTTINKSTIMENVCGVVTVPAVRRGGGGVYNKESGNLSINASTIARNSNATPADEFPLTPIADGVYNAGTATVGTTIIALNGRTGFTPWDVEGAFISQGYNLISNALLSTGFANGVLHDKIGVGTALLNPGLGSLRDNGGATPTAGLLCGSPAIDAGDDAITEPPLNFATDQRGRARRAGAHVDIGAFEVQPGERCRMLSISDATVVEGDSGKKSAVFNVTLSAPTADDVTFDYDMLSNSTGIAIHGIADNDYDYIAGKATIAGGETSTTLSVPIHGDTKFELDETFIVRLKFVTNALIGSGWGIGTIVNDDPSPVVQFSAPAYQVNEAGGDAVITVTRTGNSSDGFSVNYATVDDPDARPCRDTTPAPDVASARCDYTSIKDTLVFAPGQMQQSFNVPIIDDAHAEQAETLKVVLIAPGGLVLGAVREATITIGDNDTGAGANPIDESAFFVRQHYLDFLNREPEQSGFDAWMNVLNRCPNRFNFDPASPSAACDRITVSMAFFNSPEFREKAYLIYRLYRVAFNRRPRYDEMVRDIRSLTGRNESELAGKRFAYYTNLVMRPEFRARYDALTDNEYVDALLERYSGMGNIPPDQRLPRFILVVSLSSALRNRTDILLRVAQSPEVNAVEFNGAFVAMQYFGYLRRDAEETGYVAWLNYLNAHPGDYRTMVNGFLNSQEYRLRFGAPQ